MRASTMLNAAVIEPQAFATSQFLTGGVESVHAEPVRVALLGVGTVGKALLARLDALVASPLTQRLQLVHVANSRASICTSPAVKRTEPTLERLIAAIHRPQEEGLKIATHALGGRGIRIVIDATASDAVAEHHAQWLAQGIQSCEKGLADRADTQ